MILDRYLARRYARSLLLALAAFFALILLIDLVETVRRFGDEQGLGASLALALLGAPQTLYGVLPLVAMLAAIAMFLALARSSELVVTRGSGRSAIRALLGPGVVAALAGALAVAALNPIVAATSREHDGRVGRLDGRDSALAISDDGLWLRQGDADGQTVIRAQRSNLDGTELRGVTFLTFDPDGRPLERVDARRAVLGPGAWTLDDAKSWPLADDNPEAAAVAAARRTLPSTLTAAQIRDSFGEPSAIPIWELPRFIKRLEAAGFAARRHEVWLQMELAQPALLLAMLLLAAAFAMRPQRGRRTGATVLGALLAGFGLLALRNFAQVLGEAGQINPALAAWAPPAVGLMVAMGLLLHLEEG